MDRGRLRYWLAAAALSALAALAVHQAEARAEHAEASWGRTRTVLVAQGSIARGRPLSGRVRPIRWPTALAPPAALRDVPPSSLAATDIDDGSVLTPALVRRRHDPARDGRRTVAVALPPAALPLEAGDEVDAWASVDASIAGEGAPSTRRVARGARVVSTGPNLAVLAVRPVDVPALAAATGTATVTLVGTA